MSSIHNFRKYSSDPAKVQEVNEANTTRSTSTIVATAQIVDQYGNVLSKDDANTARTTSTKVIPTQHIDAAGKVQPAGDDKSRSIYTKLTDGSDEAGVDSTSLHIIDNPHRACHEKLHYFCEYTDEDWDNNDYADLRIKNGTSYDLHFLFSIFPEVMGRIYMYEGTTYTADGTAVSQINNNRNTPLGVASSNAYHTPTIDTLGTVLIDGRYIAAGVRNRGTGSSGNTREELILKQDTDYLVRVQNVSGNNNMFISMLFEWYEVL